MKKYTKKKKNRYLKGDLMVFRPISGIDPNTIKLLKNPQIKGRRIIVDDVFIFVVWTTNNRIHVSSLHEHGWLYIIGYKIGIVQEKVRELHCFGNKEIFEYNYRKMSYPFELIKVLRGNKINSVLMSMILLSE